MLSAVDRYAFAYHPAGAGRGKEDGDICYLLGRGEPSPGNRTAPALIELWLLLFQHGPNAPGEFCRPGRNGINPNTLRRKQTRRSAGSGALSTSPHEVVGNALDQGCSSDLKPKLRVKGDVPV